MSRLTKQLRGKMLKTVLDHAFAEKQKSAQAEVDEAGMAVYMSVHEAYLPIMQQLPDGFCYKSDRFDVNIGGQSHNIYFDGEARLMAYRSNYNRYPIEVNDPVGIAYLQALKKQEDVSSERNQMLREVNAVLGSVHTFKKLWEVWPECKSLLEKFEDKPTIAILPAVQVDRLNSALGLPAKTDAET